MMNKVNYYLKSEEIIGDLLQKAAKPRLLLHACCAPCSTFPLTYLCPHFDVTIYYQNSNIYPEEEYNKRLNELKRFLHDFELKNNYHVELIIPLYDEKQYYAFLENYKDYPEGSLRCFACYEKRMEEAYKYAQINQFDYFTTTLSVSRFKNSQKINEIGAKLENKFLPTKYFYSDFKKKDGNLVVEKMKKEYSLYQQQYCGCRFSYSEYLKRHK